MIARLLHVILLCLCFSIARASAEAPSHQRVLFVGNSITLHGTAPNIGWLGNWGMAASAAEKDYVHLVVEALAARQGKPPEYRVVNVATFERDYAKYDLEENLKEQAAFKPDTIILAIGENVPGLATEAAKTAFSASVVRLLKLLKTNPSAEIYVRSCFWANPAKDAALREACTAVDGVFVDISALGKDEKNFARAERKIEHAGVAGHPGDQGMQAIATAITEALQRPVRAR
jgi:hypothetical protein